MTAPDRVWVDAHGTSVTVDGGLCLPRIGSDTRYVREDIYDRACDAMLRFESQFNHAWADAQAVEAERDRYRAALKQILEHGPSEEPGDPCFGVAQTALVALNPEAEEATT